MGKIKNQPSKTDVLGDANNDNKKDETFLTIVFKEIKTHMLLSFTSLLVGIIAAGGVILSPLKELIFQHVWTEKAKIEIIAPDKINEGDIINVQVIVHPDSFTISPGVLTLQPNTSQSNNKNFSLIDKDLGRKDETYSTEIKEIMNAPKILPLNAKWTLQARTLGKTKLVAILKTNQGEYKGEKEVAIQEKSLSSLPLPENFTGKWPIEFGLYRGVMEIKVKEGFVTGNFDLDGSASSAIIKEGGIIGIKDGDVFSVDFIEKGANRKWKIKANIDTKPNYIKIDGKATLLTITNSKWEETVPQKTESFFASISF